MAKRKKINTVAFKRKRKGKTDYRKRLKSLLSNKYRVVIRRSIKNITVQIIEYNQKGDKVIAAAHSKELEKYGWKVSKASMPSAYLTGYLLGKKAAKKQIKEAILDLGVYTSKKKTNMYAALKGVVDAGINVPHSEDVMPEENRIKGEHISKYAEQLKKNNEYEKRFSQYTKKNTDATNITKLFEQTKNKIESETR